MLHFFQLARTGLLTPASVARLLQAKRKHGHNLCFLLKFAADQYGNKPALTDGHQHYSFRDLYKMVLRLSAVINANIEPGQGTTAILHCDNSLEHILTFYALQNLGLKLVLVNSKAHSSELTRLINRQSQPCYLFTHNSSLLPAPNTVDIPALVAKAGQANAAHFFSKRPAKLLFTTSGTTGEAKLVEKRTGELYWLRSFADLLARTGIHQRKGVYISLPISHGFGYTAVLFALVLGKKALLSTAKEPGDIIRMVNQEQTDLLVGVPASLHQLATIFRDKAHPFQSVISGGSALNHKLFDSITTVFGKNIFSIYGSTEASVSFMADYRQLHQHSNALGTAFKGIGHRLLPLPDGGYELLVRSKLSNISSGWLHTGDLAQQIEDGSLVWCGRKDNMIIKNGVNIYPEEIENYLLMHPSIEDAMVAGEQDDLKGQSILAIVKIKPGHALDGEDIKQQLRQFLPGIKIPDRIVETSSFHYTGTGKKIKQAGNPAVN